MLRLRSPLAARYAQLLRGKLAENESQALAVAELSKLEEELASAAAEPESPPVQEAKPSLWGNVKAAFASSRASLASPPAPRGLYLHGGVGVGKTLLMDLFYDSLRVGSKQRTHFHPFVLDMHSRLAALKRAAQYVPADVADRLARDPLKDVADMIAERGRVLCFDELYVTEVGDAVLLEQLFNHLWSAGCVTVITSNRAPDELYPAALQRERFTPFIQSIKQRHKVIHVGGPDYRTQSGQGADDNWRSYWGPAESDEAAAAMEAMLPAEQARAEVIEVAMGRTMAVPSASSDGVARFSFGQLCDKAVGVADYHALLERYHTLLLTDVPQLSMAKHDTARRFVSLIDILYDRQRRLLCTAAAPPDQLFVTDSSSHTKKVEAAGETTGRASTLLTDASVSVGNTAVSVAAYGSVSDLAFAFARTASRLTEMSSVDYARRHSAALERQKLVWE